MTRNATHRVTLPDGSVATRKSARVYTHAVVLDETAWIEAATAKAAAKLADPTVTGRDRMNAEADARCAANAKPFQVKRWSQNRHAAEAYAASCRKPGRLFRYTVVEVERTA